MADLDELRKKYLGIPEGDLLLSAAIQDYVDEQVIPRRLDLEGGIHLDEELAIRTKAEVQQGFVEFGLHKPTFPEEIGGLGMPLVAEWFYPVIEEMTRGDCGVHLDILLPCWVFLAAINTPNWDVLRDFGSRYCGDTLVHACLAMTEPGGGANIVDPTQEGRTLRTTARLEGDEWVINGEKLWPSGAGEAQYFMTVCTTDPSQGLNGIALIYHPRDVKGLSISRPKFKMGMIYTDSNCHMRYDNVRVPKRYRAAGPGKDAELWQEALAMARLLSGPMVIGPAQACLELVIDYLKDRKAGGKPIREHSMHAGIIADMAIAIEAARAYCYEVCRKFDKPELYGKRGDPYLHGKASGAKVMACDMSIMVINKAMELLGAIGYSKDMPVEKFLRDTKIIQLWEGGAQLARLDMTRSFYHFGI